MFLTTMVVYTVKTWSTSFCTQYFTKGLLIIYCPGGGGAEEKHLEVIFFYCSHFKAYKNFKAPSANCQDRKINFGAPPSSSTPLAFVLLNFYPCLSKQCTVDTLTKTDLLQFSRSCFNIMIFGCFLSNWCTAIFK